MLITESSPNDVDQSPTSKSNHRRPTNNYKDLNGVRFPWVFSYHSQVILHYLCSINYALYATKSPGAKLHENNGNISGQKDNKIIKIIYPHSK